jgi:hypothetical protein
MSDDVETPEEAEALLRWWAGRYREIYRLRQGADPAWAAALLCNLNHMLADARRARDDELPRRTP